MKLAGIPKPRSYRRISIPEEWAVAERRGERAIDPLEQRAKLWSRIGRSPLPEQIKQRLAIVRGTREARGQAAAETPLKVAFVTGFASEMAKLGFTLPGPHITMPALNMGMYVGALGIPRWRKWLGRVGNRVLGTGFVHALQGKRVPRFGTVGIGSGLAVGPALMSLYETGWGMGNTVAKKIESLPGGKAVKPLEALHAADVAAQFGFKHAPIAGAVVGGLGGVSRERIRQKRKRSEGTTKDFALAALEGAAKGGLVGGAVRVFGPRLPGPSQLHKLRTEHLDRVLSGQGLSRIEKVLDWGARPLKAGERAKAPASLFSSES
jgi:hypothetical protein